VSFPHIKLPRRSLDEKAKTQKRIKKEGSIEGVVWRVWEAHILSLHNLTWSSPSRAQKWKDFVAFLCKAFL